MHHAGDHYYDHTRPHVHSMHENPYAASPQLYVAELDAQGPFEPWHFCLLNEDWAGSPPQGPPWAGSPPTPGRVYGGGLYTPSPHARSPFICSIVGSPPCSGDGAHGVWFPTYFDPRLISPSPDPAPAVWRSSSSGSVESHASTGSLARRHGQPGGNVARRHSHNLRFADSIAFPRWDPRWNPELQRALWSHHSRMTPGEKREDKRRVHESNSPDSLPSAEYALLSGDDLSLTPTDRGFDPFRIRVISPIRLFSI